jgi:uncharacterized protein YdaU (DUF1376 family)
MAKSAKPPRARPDTWMPLFWGDYHRDTGHLNATQHGFYLLLIGHYWSTGKPLPDDDAQLWRIARADSVSHWKKSRAIIAAFFQIVTGFWRHTRIERELADAAMRQASAKERAEHAARMRWASAEHAPSMPDAMLGDCPLPPQSPGEPLEGSPPDCETSSSVAVGALPLRARPAIPALKRIPTDA